MLKLMKAEMEDIAGKMAGMVQEGKRSEKGRMRGLMEFGRKNSEIGYNALLKVSGRVKGIAW